MKHTAFLALAFFLLATPTHALPCATVKEARAEADRKREHDQQGTVGEVSPSDGEALPTGASLRGAPPLARPFYHQKGASYL